MTRRRKIHGIWPSRWTFILAATGSAVGLGNIWKFPYIAGENGGGAFVLVYLLCLALVGVPIMMAEVLLGRRGRQSPVNAMRSLALEAGASRGWVGVGWLGMLGGFLVVSYYCVIAGWALDYTFSLAGGQLQGVTADTANAMFETLMEDQSELVKWQTIFIVMTLVVVMGGVGKGLGVAVRVLMPLLFLFVLALVYYGSTRGDLAAALSFLFGFSAEGFTWGSFLMALGHSFLTLGLGLGAIMAYGAYMPEKVPLGKTVVIVVCLDTLFSLLVGVAIFSVVFASPSVQLREGPSLMFISLPVIFGDMPDGRLFGTVFFMMVVVVAWSSTISLLEPMVAWLVESKQYSRIRASLQVGAAAWFVGLGTVFSFNDWAEVKTFFGANFFEFLDFLTTNIMLPLSGILIAVFVGWVMRYESLRQELRNESLAIFEGWVKVLRLASPVGMLIVLVTTLYFKLSG